MKGISSDDARAGGSAFDAADSAHRVAVGMDSGAARFRSPAIDRLMQLAEAETSSQGVHFRAGGQDGDASACSPTPFAESAASKARRLYLESARAFEVPCEEFDKVAIDELLSIANARIGIARQSLNNADDPDIPMLEAFVWYIENARANNIDAGDLEIVPLKEALARLRCVLQEWKMVKKTAERPASWEGHISCAMFFFTVHHLYRLAARPEFATIQPQPVDPKEVDRVLAATDALIERPFADTPDDRDKADRNLLTAYRWYIENAAQGIVAADFLKLLPLRKALEDLDSIVENWDTVRGKEAAADQAAEASGEVLDISPRERAWQAFTSGATVCFAARDEALPRSPDPGANR